MEINFAHVLTLVFVVAKLFNFIQWSWWLVFLPSIISIGFGLLIIGFVFVLAILDAL